MFIDEIIVLRNRFKTNENPDENSYLPMDLKNIDRKLKGRPRSEKSMENL
jgi:hypothetical protein